MNKGCETNSDFPRAKNQQFYGIMNVLPLVFQCITKIILELMTTRGPSAVWYSLIKVYTHTAHTHTMWNCCGGKYFSHFEIEIKMRLFSWNGKSWIRVCQLSDDIIFFFWPKLSHISHTNQVLLLFVFVFPKTF